MSSESAAFAFGAWCAVAAASVYLSWRANRIAADANDVARAALQPFPALYMQYADWTTEPDETRPRVYQSLTVALMSAGASAVHVASIVVRGANFEYALGDRTLAEAYIQYCKDANLSLPDGVSEEDAKRDFAGNRSVRFVAPGHAIMLLGAHREQFVGRHDKQRLIDFLRSHELVVTTVVPGGRSRRDVTRLPLDGSLPRSSAE